MRFRFRTRRGQATVELALAAPLVFGLLALTLQGGIVLSDQVNIEHYAYEGAQWALANPDATSSALADHIKQKMCGGVTTIGTPGAGATRYCQQAPTGVGNLVVTVTAQTTPTSLGPMAPRALPTGGVLAAGSCKAWHLDVSLAYASGDVALKANKSATYTITLKVTGSGTDPAVALSASGYPMGLASGSPLLSPPTLYSADQQANLVISEGSKTIPGTYPVLVAGQDQCGQGPSAAATVPKLVVASATSYPSVALPPLVAVDPVKVGICAGTPTVIHLRGRGMQAGAIVQFGSVLGVGTTVIAAGAYSEVDSTTTLPAGIYDILITNLDGSKGVAAGGLTVLAAGSCPTNDPSPPTHPCSGNTPGAAYQSLIHIRWYEPLALPLLTTGAPPTVQLDANQTVLCQQ